MNLTDEEIAAEVNAGIIEDQRATITRLQNDLAAAKSALADATVEAELQRVRANENAGQFNRVQAELVARPYVLPSSWLPVVEAVEAVEQCGLCGDGCDAIIRAAMKAVKAHHEGPVRVLRAWAYESDMPERGRFVVSTSRDDDKQVPVTVTFSAPERKDKP